MTKQTLGTKQIVLTAGGCYYARHKYFKEYEGALKEVTKAECQGNEIMIVDDDDLVDLILQYSKR